ncbi:hypothetical protein [Myxosarcina sp. GI1(2024)]
MKKLINNPDNYVPESLEGMALAYPELIKINLEPNFIVRIQVSGLTKRKKRLK